MAVGVHDQHSRKVLVVDILLDQRIVNFDAVRRQERRE